MKCVWFFGMLSLAASTKSPVEEFVENNNDLSINLFYELIKIRQDNFVYGIFCLDAIIALTCLGSRGDTATEIKKAFDWNVSDTDLTSAFETAIDDLKNVKNLNIHLANKIYLNHNIKVDQKFLKVAEAFDTSVENINFDAAEESVQKINSWVSDQTARKIGGIAHEKHFTALTNMVLINTLYFRGRWNHPFESNETKKWISTYLRMKPSKWI
ncbi:hypothetical protein WA026_005627 [Henosepilachna vigintioctopunctata]|uniref:Serpin domain-containing protein n=1 Tax=Henosepilachna vigintioctopunctata TaxID=420089 RepID=A0AAW1TVL2_9CUCU